MLLKISTNYNTYYNLLLIYLPDIKFNNYIDYSNDILLLIQENYNNDVVLLLILQYNLLNFFFHF